MLMLQGYADLIIEEILDQGVFSHEVELFRLKVSERAKTDSSI